MRFSQRIGKTKIQTTIQKDTMSVSFKNRLNNLIDKIYAILPDHVDVFDDTLSGTDAEYDPPYSDFNEKCCDRFGWRLTEVYKYDDNVLGYLRGKHAGKVYPLYDMVEFLVSYLQKEEQREVIESIKSITVIKQFNDIFELEKSAYRFGGNGKLIAITDEIELEELNRADDLSKPYANVYEHLEKAKSFFSDREQPDYDKTAVESVHAIEAVCRDITGDDKAILGDALKNIKLHKALKCSLTKLYGFSGDTVRHAKKSNNIKIDENAARLILITSHSIVNYLISKYL